MAIQISKPDLAQKIEEGWKKDALAAHYGLPMAQMTKVLQASGLKIRKFHAPKFELVDEVMGEEKQEDTQEVSITEEVLDQPVVANEVQVEEKKPVEVDTPQTPISW